jgi:hypothetical protein
MDVERHPGQRVAVGQYTDIELSRIVSLREAVRLSNISKEGWYRNHSDKLIRLSPRRIGVRLRHALMLPE